MTREVAILILHDDVGRILLQHRTDDAPIFPGHWAFFGGGLEEGETPEVALRREILEELGYKLGRARYFTEHRFVHLGTEHRIHVFVARYDGSPLTLGEGQGMAWFWPAKT